jgi:hypothetical protein
MELSRAIASMAIVLGVVLAAAYAFGEENVPVPATKQTAQDKVAEREAQRREAMKQQQARKDDFARRCTSKAVKTNAEMEYCREAYRKL